MGDGSKFKAGCVATVVSIVVVIFVVMLAGSFRGVHYYEYGFLRTKSTGAVDASTVYTGGLYPVGPNKDFITFQADAHFVSLDGLDVATFEENSINIWVDFQFRLREDELNNLRLAYNTEYQEVITSTATEVIKQTTTRFTNSQILRERENLELAIATSIAEALESKCCSETCPEKGMCKIGCIQPDKCKIADRRQYIELLGVQLTDIRLSKEVSAEYLESIIFNAEEETAILNKNVSIIESETNVQVNMIRLQEEEVKQNSTAKADLIKESANAEARAIVEQAKIAGLKTLFQLAGISNIDEKNALNYLRTLRDMKTARLNVNFQNLYRNN